MNDCMSIPVPILCTDSEDNSEAVATFSFADNDLNIVRIIRRPGSEELPLLFISVGAILSWQDRYIPPMD
jgi:hypothetical protein